MPTVDVSDISTLLQKWSETKAEIIELEKKIDKYKRLASKIMDKNGDNTINSLEYKLIRKEMSRTTISKKDVPKEIWNKYSRNSIYTAYYLTEKKS
jgi:hypothetical protein